MTPKFLPKDRPGRLGRLMEECGEVLTCLGKIQRFGLDTRFDLKRMRIVKRGAESNREALRRELRDLRHAIWDLEGDLDGA